MSISKLFYNNEEFIDSSKHQEQISSPNKDLSVIEMGCSSSNTNMSSSQAKYHKNQHKQIAIKIFIHTNVAGKIIGPGGNHLKKFQYLKKVEIRMTKRNDLYPNTDYRVMLIKGQFENVKKALLVILKVILFRKSILEDFDERQSIDVSAQISYKLEIKLIIPDNIVGALIGINGKNLNQILNLSRANIKISQRPKPYQPALSERILIISGKSTAIKTAAGLVLDKLHHLNFKYDSLGISYNFFYWGPWGRKMIPNSEASGSAYYLGSFIYVQRL